MELGLGSGYRDSREGEGAVLVEAAPSVPRPLPHLHAPMHPRQDRGLRGKEGGAGGEVSAFNGGLP
jgi:hypothetical protein